MIFVIKRVSERPDGTFGVLLQDDIPFALTLELPWNDNKPNESCIPPIAYRCVLVDSPKFGRTYEVLGVPNRSHILFHKGNVDDDTRGCILVGEEFSTWDDGSVSISRSGNAFMEFMDRANGESEIWLSVR